MNLNRFVYDRNSVGRFRVFRIDGKEGDSQIVDVRYPCAREDYPNVVAVISGSGIVSGPKTSWPLNAGMIDEDMPGYPDIGNYTYEAGPEGISFFCATTKGGEPFERRRVNSSSPFTLEVGHILLVVEGVVIVNSQDGIAPIIVNASDQVKTVAPVGRIRGVELW